MYVSTLYLPFICILTVLLTKEVIGFAFTKPRTHISLSSIQAQPQATTETSQQAEIDVQALSRLDKCTSGSEAKRLLESVLSQNNEDSSSPLFGSISIAPGASEKGVSDADLAIQTKIRNSKYKITELIELNGDTDADRATVSLLSLFIASTSSAIVANQNLPGPEIFRFLAVWTLSAAPMAFVGFGIATPEKLQTMLIEIQKNIFPKYRQRMIQHEAGHFLMGHLLGLPIQGYAANAIKNAVEFYPLNDPQVGISRATQLGFDAAAQTRQEHPPQEDFYDMDDKISDAPYFSKKGRGSSLVESQSVFRNGKNYTNNPFLKVPSQNDPTQAWPFRGFDDDTIDKLTIISVAGVCAEILAFGNAQGGYADLSQLRQLFNAAASAEKMDERAMDNRVRFALGYTIRELRLHLGALDALAKVMERGGSVAECVAAIEGCPNVSGNDGIVSTDYERERRQAFRGETGGILERILLRPKTADMEEDRVIQGSGGGAKRPTFAITGDDPLYIALGVTFVFFAWASSGGLSLH